MKNKLVDLAKKEVAELESKKITRKEAIKKTGYMALSAATMMLLVDSAKAHTGSPCSSGDERYPDKGSNHHGGGHR
ncbi:MAG: hypothetical protein WAO52_16615 [Prolixibacteraceae bacterium]